MRPYLDEEGGARERARVREAQNGSGAAPELALLGLIDRREFSNIGMELLDADETG
jgi:hypothetical protein